MLMNECAGLFVKRITCFRNTHDSTLLGDATTILCHDTRAHMAAGCGLAKRGSAAQHNSPRALEGSGRCASAGKSTAAPTVRAGKKPPPPLALLASLREPVTDHEYAPPLCAALRTYVCTTWCGSVQCSCSFGKSITSIWPTGPSCRIIGSFVRSHFLGRKR